MRLRVFTDGACSGNPGIGGWGVVILKATEQHMYSGNELHTTNNQMELKAILEAMRASVNISGCKNVDIYSDSAYCVNAIKQGWLQKWSFNGWKTVKGENVKNKYLWMEVLKILKASKNLGIKFNFIKVKGHSGDKYNELADKLAKNEVEIAKSL